MKVLLIEDDTDTSALLAAKLTTHRYAVDAVTDGSAGLELAARWHYDLILLDIVIPKLNGIEVCRQLRAQGCQTPILMLTIKDSNEDVVIGLDAGADDYVVKSCEESQLLARMRALLRRSGNPVASPTLRWGTLCLDPTLARVTYSNAEVALRPKEYSLLELFLRHPQRLFSRSAIIDQLWSIEETPVEGSVTTLIKDLRQRLKAAGMNIDLIETVYGLGYRLRPSPEPQVSETADAITAQAQSHPSPQGIQKIQQITERFQVSLGQRLSVLEETAQWLTTDSLSPQQQQTARTEAHKLAGGLGTFGCAGASDIARKIEQLLTTENLSPQLSSQFTQLLKDLQYALAQPLA
jgi:DNA-binding response OmpR family regulator/HPt (histidine-containing phosphotransfer) domain-containing protein